VRAGRERQYLQAHLGQPHRLDQSCQLPRHDVGAADLPPQHGLVQDGAQLQRRTRTQYVLPGQAHFDQGVETLVVQPVHRGLRHRAGVLRRLQQAGHHRGLQRAHRAGLRLQADEIPVGRRQHTSVRLPPVVATAALVGARQHQEQLAQLGVVHLVGVEQ
jgi:hypothetical protein